MTVILVLATFLVFIVVDYMLHRGQVKQPQPAVQLRDVSVSQPAYVDGFLVPANLRYHPGHSWLMRERTRRVRVGIDEFAAALMGGIERIELPKPGVWVRQGQKALKFFRGGESAEMLSPTEGEVIEVNPEVVRDPTLIRRDPYGQGWIMVMDVPDEETMNRNLVPVTMVRNWVRDAVERLYGQQPQLAGAVAADGGRPADDLLAGMPDANWKKVTDEFFLTA